MQVEEGIIYVLKQAPHAWHEKIHAYLISLGFGNSPTERTLYVKRVDNVFLIIVVYVNDMLLTSPNEKHIVYFKIDLHASFEISNLEHLHHYLSIQFMQVVGNSFVSNNIYRHIIPAFWP